MKEIEILNSLHKEFFNFFYKIILDFFREGCEFLKKYFSPLKLIFSAFSEKAH